MVNCKNKGFFYTSSSRFCSMLILFFPHITIYAIDCMLEMVLNSGHSCLGRPQLLRNYLLLFVGEEKWCQSFFLKFLIFPFHSSLFILVFQTVFLIFLSKPRDRCCSQPWSVELLFFPWGMTLQRFTAGRSV